MRTKYIAVLCIYVITSCSSSKTKISVNDLEFQEKPPFVLEHIQYQRWVSEIPGEGFVYNMGISVLENKNYVQFDSVYYKGYAVKIEVGKMGYFATIQTPENRKEDLIMSNKQGEEYGNSTKILRNKQFDFGEKTCVIKYIEKDQVFYFKYNQVTKKEL